MIKVLSAGIAAAFALLASTLPAAAQSGEIWLTTDQVRSFDLDQPVASIVIGNPAIADVKVQSNTQILFYGKAPGLTNIYFFDKDENRIDNIDVRVQSQTEDMLVVYRGTERSSYSCTRNCEMTPVIGDSPASFQTVVGQASQKQSAAQAAASGAGS